MCRSSSGREEDIFSGLSYQQRAQSKRHQEQPKHTPLHRKAAQPEPDFLPPPASPSPGSAGALHRACDIFWIAAGKIKVRRRHIPAWVVYLRHQRLKGLDKGEAACGPRRAGGLRCCCGIYREKPEASPPQEAPPAGYIASCTIKTRPAVPAVATMVPSLRIIGALARLPIVINQASVPVSRSAEVSAWLVP